MGLFKWLAELYRASKDNVVVPVKAQVVASRC